MEERVGADLVAGVAHLAEHFGILFGGVGGEKEGSGDAVVLQHPEDRLRAGSETVVPRGPAADVGFHVKPENDLKSGHDEILSLRESRGIFPPGAAGGVRPMLF